jgi:hypothetical protein
MLEAARKIDVTLTGDASHLEFDVVVRDAHSQAAIK